MKPVLLLVALFGNMPPPSYQVTLPPGREWVYETAAWGFSAFALVAGGLWYAPGRSLRPNARRALLWLAAGCLATAYSAWWLWCNQAEVVPPNLAASVAVWMPGVWALGCAAVLFAGWRHVRGGQPGRGPLARVGRALALATVTLVAGVVVGGLGFRLAFVVLLPGIWIEEMGARTEIYGALFLGVNVGVWWVAWAVALWMHEKLRASVEPPEFRGPTDRNSANT